MSRRREAPAPHNRRLPRAAAFSLIELLLVVAIVGILAAIALYSGMRALNRSKQSRAMADMRAMHTQGRGGDSRPPRIPDPWGDEYVLTSSGGHHTLRCLGRDGRPSEGITFDTRDEFDLDIIMVDGQFTNAPVN